MGHYKFHATPTPNRDAILREGLLASKSAFNEPVHLSDDPYDAMNVAACVHEADDVTVFLVDVSGLLLNDGYDGRGTYTVLGDVGPQRLTEWRP